MKPKIVPVNKVTKYFNEDTGELKITEEEYYTKIQAEPNYVKLYLLDIARFKRLTTRPILVLTELLKLMDYRNEVSLSHGIKLEICKSLGFIAVKSGKQVLSLNALDQQLVKLSKAGLIMRKGAARGLYVMNPKIFGKGMWKDIKGIILQIRYDKKGREFLSNIEPEVKKEPKPKNKNKDGKTKTKTAC